MKRLLSLVVSSALVGCAMDRSARSSDGSVGTSNNSNESSKGSAASSNTDSNQTTQQSSANSTRGTTEDSSKSNSSNNANLGPVLTTAGLVVVVAGMGVIIWAILRKRTPDPAETPPPVDETLVPTPASPPLPPPTPQSVEAARVFLAANRVQLSQDLALGAGRSIEDLAGAAGIRAENLGRFGRALRAHRAELAAMVQVEPLTRDAALTLLRRVGEIAEQDERLRQDGLAFLSRGAAVSP